VIPWPSSIESSDYFMLVLLPLVLNLAVVLALWTLLERRR
jgi:hypothetical protein